MVVHDYIGYLPELNWDRKRVGIIESNPSFKITKSRKKKLKEKKN